eukprot:2180030-Rhodomonas_salina.1
MCETAVRFREPSLVSSNEARSACEQSWANPSSLVYQFNRVSAACDAVAQAPAEQHPMPRSTTRRAPPAQPAPTQTVGSPGATSTLSTCNCYLIQEAGKGGCEHRALGQQGRG